MLFGRGSACAEACKKEADDPGKPALLTAPSWRVSARTHTTTFSYGSPSVRDEYATMGTCEKDNYTTFNADHTVLADEGATKCNAAAPQTDTGTWSLSSHDAQLTIVGTAPGSSPLVYEVLELSATTLRLRYTYSSTSGVAGNFVTETTYAAF